MKYLDEEILKKRQETESNDNDIIHENMQIIDFEQIRLFEDFIEVQIPKGFTDLPKDLAKIKYPMEQRPDIIKTNADTSINFAFNLLPLDSANPPIEEIITFFHSIIKKMQPANRFIDKKINKNGNEEFGYFDFISPALDEKLYTLMSFFVFGDILLQATFNCPAGEFEHWKNIAIKCIESVVKLEEENESQ